jgi:hypothetical protein
MGMVLIARFGWKGIEVESILEMDRLLMTNSFNRNLLETEAQPATIEYWFDGKWLKSFPDFRMSVSTDSRSALVEGKTLNPSANDYARRRAGTPHESACHSTDHASTRRLRWINTPVVAGRTNPPKFLNSRGVGT